MTQPTPAMLQAHLATSKAAIEKALADNDVLVRVTRMLEAMVEMQNALGILADK